MGSDFRPAAEPDDAPFGAAWPPLSTLARDLRAEAISIRVRWFGIAVGLAIANGPVLLEPGGWSWGRLAALNALLVLGAGYAAADTAASRRGHVFLGDVPRLVSAMEAVFIGLLCVFGGGADSPFRVYYFLSLLIAAIRYREAVTWSTLGLHAASYGAVALFAGGVSWPAAGLTLVTMAWVTWACVQLTNLLRRRSGELRRANAELVEQQGELERRIAERTAELQESQGLLVQQEKQAAFGLLAAGIAHEVGNPLASISGLVQMLSRRTHEDYTSQRLATIDAEVQRIQRTLREMTNFSRPASKQRMRSDVREACEAALSIAKYYKRRKGKRVTTCYGEIPPVDTVHDQVVQVVLNLVLNAMDATHEGGSVEVSTRPEGGAVVIRVRDDGEGVPEATRADVFKPYVTSKPDGTGLGLFVCRNIARELGGELTLEETGAEGSTFALALPVGRSSA